MRIASVGCFLLLSAFALSGCSTFQGAQRVVDENGPLAPRDGARKPVATDCSGVDADNCNAILNFVLSYNVAAAEAAAISRGDTLWPTTIAKEPPDAQKPAAPAEHALAAATPATARPVIGVIAEPNSATDLVSIHARQMAIDGASLVRSYCESFYDTGGDSQKWLGVARDTLSASGALASGVLAIASPANSIAAAALALSTASASSAFDIYTKNFLFGSDNIASVRQGTMLALSQHEDQDAYKLNDPSDTTAVWDFRKAKTFVEEEQEICTPARIRSDVLSAIQQGPPPSSATPTTKDTLQKTN